MTHRVMRPTRPHPCNARGGGEVTGGLRCLFVDLFEYQARDLLASHGVPVLPGGVAETPEEAEAIAREIAAPVVVKAQVKVGGRGKAGGVKLADNPEDAKARAQDILGLDIKGHITHKVMVAQASDIAAEYYFSYLLDRSNRTFLAMASVEGGMEIEEIAVDQARGAGPHPDRRDQGRRRGQGRRDRRRGELPGRGARPGDRHRRPAVGGLHARRTPRWSRSTHWPRRPTAPSSRSTRRSPSTRTPTSGRPEHAALEDAASADPLEAAAKEKNLNYVKLDGEVGIIGNGAGLVMSTLDVVAYAGEEFGGVKPANFLDIGGGASAEVMANGLHIILSDPAVKSVFVNVFGGITACDAVANGIVSALGILGDEATKPLVVRLDGNNVEEGRRILAEANHPLVTVVDTMDGAARRAAELAA